MPIGAAEGILEVENAKFSASEFIATTSVGIGTTSASAYPLVIFKETEPEIRIQEGDTQSSGARFYSNNSNLYIQTGTDFSSGSSGDIAFQNMGGQSTHVIVKSDGKVGVGTDSPGGVLDINGLKTKFRYEYRFQDLWTSNNNQTFTIPIIGQSARGLMLVEAKVIQVSANSSAQRIARVKGMISNYGTGNFYMTVIEGENVSAFETYIVGTNDGAGGTFTMKYQPQEGYLQSVVCRLYLKIWYGGYTSSFGSLTRTDTGSNSALTAPSFDTATKTFGGNVGIGTTNPTLTLDIHSSGYNRIGRRLPSGSVHDADKRDEVYIGRWDGTTLTEFTGMACQVGSYTNMGYGNCGNQSSLKFFTWGCNYAGSRVVFEMRGSGQSYSNGSLVSSDDRLKTNEEYIENALDTILKLKPQKYIKHNFDYIEVTEDEYSNVIDGNVFVEKSNLYVNVNDLTYHTPTNTWYKQTLSNNGVGEAGIMVQDVWYDAPELRYLVSPSKDANIKETRDEIFTDPQEDPDYSDWGKESAHLNYTSLIPYLIKSIQELHDENKSLKRRIETLENYNVYN